MALTFEETVELECEAQRRAEDMDIEEMAADLGLDEHVAFAAAYEGILMDLVTDAEQVGVQKAIERGRAWD